MGNRFRMLKVFGLLFKVVAWAALAIGGTGAAGVLLNRGTPEAPRGMSVVILLVSALYFMLFFALGEIIRLLLTIEEQTRKP